MRTKVTLYGLCHVEVNPKHIFRKKCGRMGILLTIFIVYIICWLIIFQIDKTISYTAYQHTAVLQKNSMCSKNKQSFKTEVFLLWVNKMFLFSTSIFICTKANLTIYLVYTSNYLKIHSDDRVFWRLKCWDWLDDKIALGFYVWDYSGDDYRDFDQMKYYSYLFVWFKNYCMKYENYCKLMVISHSVIYCTVYTMISVYLKYYFHRIKVTE